MAKRPSKHQSTREVTKEITSRLKTKTLSDYTMAKDLIQKGSPPQGWLEAHITKLLNNDDGLFALEIFLQEYKRISVSTACKAIKHLHVWLYIDNYWTQWPRKKVDQFLQGLLKPGAKTSVCHALMTNEFKLSDVQYQTMKNTFLSSTWRDVAGLYQHRTEKDDFAVVVRLPVEAPGVISRVALGGALGAVSPELVKGVRNRITPLLAN